MTSSGGDLKIEAEKYFNLGDAEDGSILLMYMYTLNYSRTMKKGLKTCPLKYLNDYSIMKISIMCNPKIQLCHILLRCSGDRVVAGNHSCHFFPLHYIEIC